jgi:hypothetical protein
MKRIDLKPQTETIHPEPEAILIDLDPHELRNLTESGKRQHLSEGIFRALEVAETESRKSRKSRGQPPRVDRLPEVARLVEQLEAQNVPFGVTSTGIMNRRVRNLLNEKAATSKDPRKSRRKQITAAAVRKWLRDVRALRRLSDHFTKMYPYTD